MQTSSAERGNPDSLKRAKPIEPAVHVCNRYSWLCIFP